MLRKAKDEKGAGVLTLALRMLLVMDSGEGPGRREGREKLESCLGSRPCPSQLHCSEMWLELTTKVTGDASVS